MGLERRYALRSSRKNRVLNREAGSRSLGRANNAFLIDPGSLLNSFDHLRRDNGQEEIGLALDVLSDLAQRPSQGGDTERYYAAFVNDLQQNNVGAVWHAPEPVIDAPRRPGFP
jgi:hypothetical protein